MKLTPILILLLLGVLALNAQKIDTLKLKNEVINLKTFEDKKNFLQTIYETDQNNRLTDADKSIDYKHLISISYFINAFGYPNRKEFGRCASAPWLIWVHNSYRELNRATFPIILKGFQDQYIDEGDLRTYYLELLYKERFDDERHLTIPLKKLFRICEVETGDKISINNILEAKANIDRFNQLEIVEESNWQSGDVFRTILIDGEEVKKKRPGDVISFFEKENGKIYLLRVYEDDSGEPRELEKIAPNKYKFKSQKTDKYFEILEDRILFKNQTEILKEFKNIDK